MTTKPKSDFSSVFTRFKDMLSKYADENLQIRAGKPDQCELIGPPTPRSLGREVWFGAVRIGKRYVSYHLMPVYAFPDLLNEISPELKKRMQGKSCFNFTHVDERLFLELVELTERGYERFKKEGLIGKM
jgi:hypothetical protein